MADTRIAFDVGEVVTYYPRKLNQDDNRHWPARVIEIRRDGRYVVEIQQPPRPARRIVTWRRLARQLEIAT